MLFWVLAVESKAQSSVGYVLSSTANSTVITHSAGVQVPATRRTDLYMGDTVSTRSNESLILRMLDSSQIQLYCESQLLIRQYPQTQRLTPIILELVSGNMRLIDGRVRNQDFTVITPVATLEQNKANFEIIQESPTLYLFALYDGTMRLSSPQGEVIQDAIEEPRFLSFPQGGMPKILTAAEYLSRRTAVCATVNNR